MSTPRSSQLRAQIEAKSLKLWLQGVQRNLVPLEDVLTLLDAEPEQGWQDPKANCSCGQQGSRERGYCHSGGRTCDCECHGEIAMPDVRDPVSLRARLEALIAKWQDAAVWEHDDMSNVQSAQTFDQCASELRDVLSPASPVPAGLVEAKRLVDLIEREAFSLTPDVSVVG